MGQVPLSVRTAAGFCEMLSRWVRLPHLLLAGESTWNLKKLLGLKAVTQLQVRIRTPKQRTTALVHHPIHFYTISPTWGCLLHSGGLTRVALAWRHLCRHGSGWPWRSKPYLFFLKVTQQIGINILLSYSLSILSKVLDKITFSQWV